MGVCAAGLQNVSERDGSMGRGTAKAPRPAFQRARHDPPDCNEGAEFKADAASVAMNKSRPPRKPPHRWSRRGNGSGSGPGRQGEGRAATEAACRSALFQIESAPAAPTRHLWPGPGRSAAAPSASHSRAGRDSAVGAPSRRGAAACWASAASLCGPWEGARPPSAGVGPGRDLLDDGRNGPQGAQRLACRMGGLGLRGDGLVRGWSPAGRGALRGHGAARLRRDRCRVARHP